MLVGWNRVAPGQDRAAVELWTEMIGWLRALHAAGRIDHFEPVLLVAHGGSLNGFALVRGSQDQIDRVRNSDEFLRLNVRANKHLDGFTVLRAHFGEEVAHILRLYAAP
jgi:hypothetical protein